MADMDASKASARKGVRVRIPLPAPSLALVTVAARKLSVTFATLSVCILEKLLTVPCVRPPKG